jgi:hypothetical protein
VPGTFRQALDGILCQARFARLLVRRAWYGAAVTANGARATLGAARVVRGVGGRSGFVGGSGNGEGPRRRPRHTLGRVAAARDGLGGRVRTAQVALGSGSRLTANGGRRTATAPGRRLGRRVSSGASEVARASWVVRGTAKGHGGGRATPWAVSPLPETGSEVGFARRRLPLAAAHGSRRAADGELQRLQGDAWGGACRPGRRRSLGLLGWFGERRRATAAAAPHLGPCRRCPRRARRSGSHGAGCPWQRLTAHGERRTANCNGSRATLGAARVVRGVGGRSGFLGGSGNGGGPRRRPRHTLGRVAAARDGLGGRVRTAQVALGSGSRLTASGGRRTATAPGRRLGRRVSSGASEVARASWVVRGTAEGERLPRAPAGTPASTMGRRGRRGRRSPRG